MTSNLDLELERGDARDLSIPLILDGAAYTVPSGANLIFTAKAALSDADASAKFQKSTGAGITTSGSTATVEIVHADTKSLTETVLYWDIQSQETGGEVYTVRQGKITLKHDATRNTSTSVAVSTTNPPTYGTSSKTLWVDGTNGSDTTGLKGRMDLPFASITAAITAASSGDLVYVRPGTYSGQVTLKNGVNLWFDAGVTVTYASTGTGATITDGGAAVTCKIGGLGTITRTGNDTAGHCLLVSHASSTVYAEVYSLAAPDADASAVKVSAGTAYIGISGLVSGSATYGIEATGGTTHLWASSITAGTAAIRATGSAVVHAIVERVLESDAPVDVIDTATVYLSLQKADNPPNVTWNTGAKLIRTDGAAVRVDASFTAVAGQQYHAIGNTMTISDPPQFQGANYWVTVVHGSVVINGVTYSTAGTRILREWHSSAWKTFKYLPD